MISLKQLLREKDFIAGATVTEWLRPSLVKLYKRAGFDFIYVEYEHCFMNPMALNDFIISARDNNLPVVAKTPELFRHLIAKLLDAGVSGIQLPRTSSASDVAKLVEYSKYPPIGTRAAITGTGSTDYEHIPTGEHIKRLTEELLIIAHVETRQAVENIEVIVAEPGLDVCYVGTFDLAIELGTPGEMNSPAVLAAMDRICAVCRKNNVIIGANGSDPETIRSLRAKGVRFFECPSELDFLSRAARDFVRRL